MKWLAKLFKGTFLQALKLASVVGLAKLEEDMAEKGCTNKEKALIRDFSVALVAAIVAAIEDDL
jgi:hypothetical protein